MARLESKGKRRPAFLAAVAAGGAGGPLSSTAGGTHTNAALVSRSSSPCCLTWACVTASSACSALVFDDFTLTSCRSCAGNADLLMLVLLAGSAGSAVPAGLGGVAAGASITGTTRLAGGAAASGTGTTRLAGGAAAGAAPRSATSISFSFGRPRDLPLGTLPLFALALQCSRTGGSAGGQLRAEAAVGRKDIVLGAMPNARPLGAEGVQGRALLEGHAGITPPSRWIGKQENSSDESRRRRESLAPRGDCPPVPPFQRMRLNRATDLGSGH